MKLGIIDIVIIVLLILAFLWGFAKGFGKNGAGRFAFLVGALVGYFGGVPVARALMNTSLGNSSLTSFFASKLPTTSDFTLDISSLDSSAKESAMSTALGDLGFPTFFKPMFITRATVTNKTVSSALGSSFAFWTLIAICVLVFFIVSFAIVKALCKHKVSSNDSNGNESSEERDIFGEKGKSFLGRFAGSISKVVLTSVFIFGLMMVLVLIDQLTLNNGVTGLNNWLVSDLKLDDSSTFSIGRLFYNSAASLLNWITLKVN